MAPQIICHYTFFSNEINPLGGLTILAFIAIWFFFIIRIWIGDKRENNKIKVARQIKKADFTSRAESILSRRNPSDPILEKIQLNYNWHRWFVKGYVEAAEQGNCYSAYNAPIKAESEFTLDEWQKYQRLYYSDKPNDSDFFGGDKEMALKAYFLGHLHGLDLYKAIH